LSAAVAALLLVATLLSASAVARERDDRTLDLLLTTPLQPRDYLRGKLLGLARVMWPPTVALMLVALCIAVVGWTTPTPEGQPSPALAAGMLPGGAVALALGLPGLLATGIAIGLTWSVRSRQWTTAAAAGLVVTALATGGAAFIATLAGADIPALGPVLVGGVPLVVAQAASDPGGWLDLKNTNLDTLNQQLLIGGCLGAVAWFIAALAILRATSMSFTTTVRRLAGLD
jgi:ABC-type transport system involved in multi-copper enzyme maturation permease subunit